jgi:O-antigen/teichoic acid export membrane protein
MWLAVTYTIAMFSTFVIGMWLLRKYPIKKPSLKLFKSYFTFALPTALYSVIAIISLNIDKLMIGFFWDDIHVGYYFSVQQILQIIMILYIGVGTVLFPTISDYHSKNDVKKINKTTHQAERYISMVMVPPVAVIIALVYPVINNVLSSDFLPAANVMITLSVYTLIFSLSRPYAALINGMNRPAITTKIGLMICLVNIPLNYFFIPQGGLLSPLGINGPTGAAIATTLSVIVGFIGLRVAAKKLSGIKILQTHTLKHIIAGVIMGLILHYLAFRTSYFPDIYWYYLVFFGIFGLAVYLGVLFILREFSKKDFYFFLDIVHPKKMVKYVSDELKDKPKK